LSLTQPPRTPQYAEVSQRQKKKRREAEKSGKKTPLFSLLISARPLRSLRLGGENGFAKSPEN
jgi:hypothetical protein